jgi:hypothetical protein
MYVKLIPGTVSDSWFRSISKDIIMSSYMDDAVDMVTSIYC